MPRRIELSEQQRIEAVLSLLRREEPASKLARRYGISEPTLNRLRDQFLQGGQAALTARGARADGPERRVQELEREIERRDQVIGELTIANRILKKVSAGSASMGSCASK